VYLSSRRSDDALALDLAGDWRVRNFGALARELAAVPLAGAHSVLIDAARLEALDLSAAWLLQGFIERAHAAGAQVHFIAGEPDLIRLVEPRAAAASAAAVPAVTIESPAPARRWLTEPLALLGRNTVLAGRDSLGGLSFLGRAALTLLSAIARPRRLRPVSIARHLYDTGVTAIPIITLIAFLISVIIAYLGAQQLARYGATILVADLVAIGVLRELGVLLTAIIVAGRSGSAFAAEIGSMRLNEEVDALYAMGVDPFEVLVLPRLLGLALALPLLTIVADLVGLAGGAVLCRAVLHIPLSQYLVRVREAISATTFWVGVIKAPVFAILIGAAGTLRGMQVSGSSRELGRLTTMAVVQAIFLVILADAIFAIVFMELDI